MTFTPLTINGTSAIVHLTKGKISLIDVEDWDRVSSAGRWHAHRARPGHDIWYARNKTGKNATFLHTLILGVPGGDHKDRDRLNNRKSNLRPANQSLNMANRTGKPNRNGYRGVREQRAGGFQAIIRREKTTYCLGTYSTPERAARAYDAAAVNLFGEFATLNFPSEEANAR